MTRTVRIVMGDGKLATLVRDARRADGLQVPAPLPGQRAFASVASYDKPDEVVREAAQASESQAA